MFQFPEFPAYTYEFSIRSAILHRGGFPIRKSADQGLFTAPRSLSQLVTSFVGSQCQGIHLMLFFAWTVFRLFSFIAWASFTVNCYWVFFNFAVEKALFSPLSWQNCSSHIIWKDLKFWSLKSLLNYLFVCFSSIYSVFNEHSVKFKK